nr:MAG TPA: hypothetical protein [Caudoviricetes sp.]
MLENSLLGKFVHFFISTDSNDNNHHIKKKFPV